MLGFSSGGIVSDETVYSSSGVWAGIESVLVCLSVFYIFYGASIIMSFWACEISINCVIFCSVILVGKSIFSIWVPIETDFKILFWFISTIFIGDALIKESSSSIIGVNLVPMVSVNVFFKLSPSFVGIFIISGTVGSFYSSFLTSVIGYTYVGKFSIALTKAY